MEERYSASAWEIERRQKKATLLEEYGIKELIAAILGTQGVYYFDDPVSGRH